MVNYTTSTVGKQPKTPCARFMCCLETFRIICYTCTMMEKVCKNELLNLGAKESIPLSSLSSFHIGGPAAFVMEADNADAVLKALSVCKSCGLPVALIGNGSNLLCPDEGFEGLVIKLKKTGALPKIKSNHFTAFAGDSLSRIANFSVNSGYAGFERLAGIPGSVGGAVAMNAGAYGGEIKDVLSKVHIINNGIDTWERIRTNDFGYRKSPYAWPEVILLEAEFEVAAADENTSEIMNDCMQKRKDKQPLEFPSAGSVFKRPDGYFAGKLIEDAGLKGLRFGGAEVSEKHAGFIVNRGGATEADVLRLIEHIQVTVKELFGVSLEREILRLREIVCTF